MAGDGSEQDYVVTVTAAPSPLAVGDAYEGGVIAYLFTPEDPGYVAGESHGLIVANADLPAAAWSTVTSAEVDGTSSGIGSGAANTAAIVAQPGCTGGAAWACASYSSGGYDDWYLPSDQELLALLPHLADIGGFTSADFYWSSTEWAAGDSWAVRVSDGTEGVFSKSSTLSVRPMRTF